MRNLLSKAKSGAKYNDDDSQLFLLQVKLLLVDELVLVTVQFTSSVRICNSINGQRYMYLQLSLLSL